MSCRGHVLRLVLLLGALMACGCQKKINQHRPQCSPVSGKVLIDGVPAVRAVIALYPKAPQFEGKEYVGQTFTDDQGAFKMTTFTSGDGVPAGEYVVTIEANWVSREGQDVEVPDLLKEQYSDRKKSPLKATVGEKSIVLETFDLKSKP